MGTSSVSLTTMARRRHIAATAFRLSRRHFRNLSLPDGPERGLAAKATEDLGASGLGQREILARLRGVSDTPASYVSDTTLGPLATALRTMGS